MAEIDIDRIRHRNVEADFKYIRWVRECLVEEIAKGMPDWLGLDREQVMVIGLSKALQIGFYLGAEYPRELGALMAEIASQSGHEQLVGDSLLAFLEAD